MLCRVGRDGKSSESVRSQSFEVSFAIYKICMVMYLSSCFQVMYASEEQFEELKKLEKGKRTGSVAEVAHYALRPICRRRALLQYFGEKR